MPRVRPADRFDQLVRTAAETFIRAGGFHRTQIADIAKSLGVAKGTVYLLADSKDALFEAALEHADAPAPIPAPSPLPISTSDEGRAAALLRARISRESQFPVLRDATQSRPPTDINRELGEVFGELYDVLARNQVAIKLLTVTASELPLLAKEWFVGGRGRLLDRLAIYLSRRSSAGALASYPSAEISARLILETASWFAVHRHYDPSPEPIDDADARAEVVRSLTRSFSPEPC